MTTYVVHAADGTAVSIGTRLADPLPEGLTAAALSIEDADRLADGTGQWDPATLTVADRAPSPPGPLEQFTRLVGIVGDEGLARSALLGAQLAGDAGDLWDALGEISQANTARPAIEIVTAAALTAATTPLEDP